MGTVQLREQIQQKGGSDIGEPALLKAKSAMQATTGSAISMPTFLPAKQKISTHYCSGPDANCMSKK
jgi:hypothetical protein